MKGLKYFTLVIMNIEYIKVNFFKYITKKTQLFFTISYFFLTFTSNVHSLSNSCVPHKS